MNSVQLIGRLTRDPEAAHTSSGVAVTTLRVAVDRPGRDGADFVTVKAWQRLAETTAAHLSRGRRVAVVGRLAHEEWTAADGRRAERLAVVADRVQFLDAPPPGRDARGEQPPDSESSDRAAEHADKVAEPAGAGAGLGPHTP